MTPPIQSVAATLGVTAEPKPQKIEEAAQQFESFMIAQLLRSGRDSSPGGLGDDESDSESATMLDMANQQFSQMMAKQGGIGLSHLLVTGLRQAK